MAELEEKYSPILGLKKVVLDIPDEENIPIVIDLPLLRSQEYYAFWFYKLYQWVKLLVNENAEYFLLYLRDEREAEKYLNSREDIDKEEVKRRIRVLILYACKTGITEHLKEYYAMKSGLLVYFNLEAFQEFHEYMCTFTQLDLVKFYMYWSEIMTKRPSAIFENESFDERRTILNAYRFDSADFEHFYCLASRPDYDNELFAYYSSFPYERVWLQRIHDACLAPMIGHQTSVAVYQKKGMCRDPQIGATKKEPEEKGSGSKRHGRRRAKRYRRKAVRVD